jgi:hypothetical protein
LSFKLFMSRFVSADSQMAPPCWATLFENVLARKVVEVTSR